MADGHDKSDEVIVKTEEESSTETFHNIGEEVCPTKMCLLLKVTQSGQCPLPIGVVTERSVMALVKRVTNVTPTAVTLMNDIDNVVEFGRGAHLFEISSVLHAVTVWDKYQVSVGCIFSTKRLIVEMVKEIE